MPATKSRRWEELDAKTREELNARYLEELESWSEPGLSDEAVQNYLQYRRERPDAAITTFEEGQIRKMLHRLSDASKRPYPADLEEHPHPLEKIAASKLHLTNAETYVSIMVVLTFGAFLVLIAYLLWA